MRISGWSSDLCSSDLLLHRALRGNRLRPHRKAEPRQLGGVARAGLDHQPAHLARDHRLCQQLAEVALVGRRGRSDDDDVALLALLDRHVDHPRSEEHTSELQSLMRISYAVFCLKKKTEQQQY